MFNALLLVAVLPLLAKAQQNQQIPLKEPGAGIVRPLTVGRYLTTAVTLV